MKRDGFGCEPEITSKVVRRGYRIDEVPLSYDGRRDAEGKKSTWKDGLSALSSIVRYRLAA